MFGANHSNEIASAVADRKVFTSILFQGKCADHGGSVFAGCLLSETFHILFYYLSCSFMSNSVLFLLCYFNEIGFFLLSPLTEMTNRTKGPFM